MCPGPGLYVVSTFCSADGDGVSPIEAEFNDGAIGYWINRLPDFKIDGVKPDVESVKERLAEFWIPEENILYIGQTGKNLDKRVLDYYNTPLGDKRPHSGGQWIKTLRKINELYVYYAGVHSKDDAVRLETEMLKFFISEVGELPFANLEGPNGRKRHGLKNQREH